MAEDPKRVSEGGEEKEQSAGQDPAIRQRLKKNPASEDAQLDEALDESMDASDPPSVTQPGKSEPAPSSGFDEAEEKAKAGAP